MTTPTSRRAQAADALIEGDERADFARGGVPGSTGRRWGSAWAVGRARSDPDWQSSRVRGSHERPRRAGRRRRRSSHRSQRHLDGAQGAARQPRELHIRSRRRLTRVGKAWVNRNVPLPANWQFDPKSIASQEQFNKQAGLLAQSQFAAIGGTGTDTKFNASYSTSPNETLSKMGNKGIIRFLKGNGDAIQAKTEAWQQWRYGTMGAPKRGIPPTEPQGADTYDQFSREFNSHFDPRAFQFKYIPKAERQTYVDRMDPEEHLFWRPPGQQHARKRLRGC
jgi:hypothetical protein